MFESGFGGINPREQATLAARADRHVAANRERQAAEHGLFGDARVGQDDLADAVGEVFVVCHLGIISSRGPAQSGC